MTQIWTAEDGELVRLGHDSGDTFVLGTTKPDAANTGVPAGTSLTTVKPTGRSINREHRATRALQYHRNPLPRSIM